MWLATFNVAKLWFAMKDVVADFGDLPPVPTEQHEQYQRDDDAMRAAQDGRSLGEEVAQAPSHSEPHSLSPEQQREIEREESDKQFELLDDAHEMDKGGSDVEILQENLAREGQKHQQEAGELPLESPEQPAPKPQSLEISGPQVEKEIAQQEALRKEHEAALSDLKKDHAADLAREAEKVDKYRDELSERYADSPKQQEHLDNFEKAAEDGMRARVEQQAAQVQELQQQQQREQLRLQHQQVELQQMQAPRPPDPAPAL